MKHSYCFLLLLISFTLSAQRTPPAPVHGSYLSKTKSFESNKSLLHAYTTSNPQNKASKLAQLNQEALKRLLTGFIMDEIDGGQWTPSSKSEFTYDDAGRNISYTALAWDGDVWVKVYKEIFQYAPNNTTVTKIEYEYFNDVETPNYKYEFVYNANGKLTSLYSYGWDAATSTWGNGYLETYTYNAANQLIEQQMNFWDSVFLQWSPTTKTTYVYNSSNLPAEETYYYWPSSAWQITGHTIYQYNSNGLLINRLYAYYDGSNFTDSKRTDYTYDADGNLLTEIDQTIVLGDWENDSNSEYTYSASGDRTGEIFYSWNSSTSEWDPIDSSVYTYDDDYARNELIIPDIFTEAEAYFNHMIIDYHGTSYTDGIGELTERANFIWTSADVSNTTSINQTLALQLSPNPATDQINLTTEQPLDDATLTLTNLAGQIVLQQGLHDQKAIEVGHLHSGLYFYQVSSPKTGVANGKVVIEK